MQVYLHRLTLGNSLAEKVTSAEAFLGLASAVGVLPAPPSAALTHGIGS